MFHFQSIEIVDYILKLKKKLRNLLQMEIYLHFKLNFIIITLSHIKRLTPCIKSFWMLKIKSRTYIL